MMQIHFCSTGTNLVKLRLAWLLTLAFMMCPQASAAERDEPLPDKIQFNRDIRPILSDRCFACHGPDKNKREAELRLDTEHGLVGGGEKAGAVVPGKPGESELVRRLEADDPMERMPPAEFGKEVSPRERELIRRWIEQGATWQGHWAFQPIQKVAPPEIDDARFSRNPIDQFVFAAMVREGLSPTSPAERRVLARRLSLDLVGLPPDPELVERFAESNSTQAYEQLVDELLASPHFGERMAMWWLDLVRYADTVGYHGDQNVSISPYRDYVIRAFNENKRFDQFTIEQLAGDLLPEPTTEQLIASGYNRLGMMSAEGGVQPKEYLSKYISERVRNLSGAWLGVTLGCCECHDHKFDPFATKEFYQFEAFFADIEEQGLYAGAHETGRWGPNMPVPTEEQTRTLADLDQQIAAVKLVLDTPTDELAKGQATWETAQAPWTVLKPEKAESAGGATLTVQDDASILASGTNPDTDTYTLTLSSLPQGITGLRIEVLPHDSLPKKGPGRAGNGNFVLSELETFVLPTDEGATDQPVKLQNASATYEQTGAAGDNPYGKWAAAAIVDGDAKGPTWGWAVMEQAGRANSAVVETVEDVKTGDGKLKLVLKQNLNNPKHTLGHFRISATTAPRPVQASQVVSPEIDAILRIAGDQRNDEQRKQLAAHYRGIAPELEPQRAELKRVEEARNQADAAITRTLITKKTEPRTIRILKRGNWMDETGEIVQPAIPAMFGGAAPGETRLTRADLAKWVVAPENPLTARAFANRIWKLFFGAGLSRKLDDLGAQGEWPSHPELLDTLAAEFIESGWDVKRLVKQIVMTEAYRQSSVVSAEVAERDPYNRWLSHQLRWRLDAEVVRDSALEISGLLVESIGGKSVNPYQPPGYWSHLNFPPREWQNGTGAQLYRRGIYTHWQRQYLHPAMLAFDAPSREECTADRPRSNTPLQALVLLNDPEFVEAARVFAERILAEGGSTDADRLRWAVEKALMRPIRDAEGVVLQSLLDRQRQQYSVDSAAVDQVLAVGSDPVNADANKNEIAAWTSVARTLLNLHETITRN